MGPDPAIGGTVFGGTALGGSALGGTVFGYLVAALFGLVVGSFLNVVIWRLPRGLNLSKPPSHCPGCQRRIRWIENIPVFSWLIQAGRCRGCRQPIRFRYPFVELLTGFLFFAAAWAWGHHVITAVVVALALAALVAITYIDWDHKIIPDVISKPGIVLGVLVAPLTVLPDRPQQILGGAKPGLNALLIALAGVAVGAGILLAIRWLGSVLKKREAMGLGDVKLLAFLGALLGPIYVLVALVLGSIAGSLIGLALVLIGRARALPCEAEVRAGERVARRDRVRIRDGLLHLEGVPGGTAGEAAQVELLLPAARTLTEQDVRIRAKGTLKQVGVDGAHWAVEIEDLSDVDDEHLFLFRNSYRYVPFGPFLALGGVLCLLVPQQIWELVTVTYPAWIRSLTGGA